MKKFFYLFILSSFIIFNLPGQAQFKDWGTKFGIQGSLLLPENEFANLGFSGNDNFSFDWFKTSLLGEAFFGVELSPLLELRFAAGYGQYTGKAITNKIEYGEYKTSIIPVTLKLRAYPFNLSWNPYFFIGAGFMHYDIKTAAGLRSSVQTDSKGWTVNLPIGFGAEFALSNRVLFDFSFGHAYGGTRAMDSYSSSSSTWGDSYLHTTLGLTFTGENCLTDGDDDELGVCDEETAGTDPDNPDSDSDGLLDGEEHLSYKTDPLRADTDLDGLSDGMEVNTAKTDPLSDDTDSDQLTDGVEYERYKTNPLLADTDNDKLNDSYEILKSKTNPLFPDTDKDGLTDADELQKYKTNPLNEDTDREGLSDSEEISMKTDPLVKDTDHGSIDDFIEYTRGTDPLDGSDDVLKMNVPIVLEGITFSTGKADITPESESVLRKALETMKKYPDMVVEISGHTDDVGNADANKRLSDLRAHQVRIWLISKGIPSKRLTSTGYGEQQPRVPNDTPENRRLNRRIEFKRIK